MTRQPWTPSADLLTLNPQLAAQLRAATIAPRKYRNTPVVVDGIRFASLAEAARYGELLLLLRAGAIQDLRIHPRYELLPKRPGQRARAYVADFAYTEQGRTIVEDVKGGNATQTPLFRLKARLFRERYGDLELRVVRR